MDTANTHYGLKQEPKAQRRVDKETPLYSISTVARMLGISVHTLRMYERKGLIIPYKGSSNQRLYSDVDIERLHCIRTAINTDKISIEGIRHVLSLIPCWAIMKCSATDRSRCAAYNGSIQPCWTLKHKDNVCAQRDCRQCGIYREMADCHRIKEQLKQMLPV